MKPSDAFIGVIDFFATLIPGAVAAFLLLLLNHRQTLISLPRDWPISWNSKEGWAVFLVGAYLLGHGIAAVGSLLLDTPLYDRVYARWQRTDPKWVRPTPLLPGTDWVGRLRYRWEILKARTHHVWKRSNPEDTLVSAAKILKKRQLRGLLQDTDHRPDEISNTFWWAGTVVRLKSPAGTAEIESLQAQSKLFRSLTVILLAMVPWWFSTWPFAVIWFVFLVLSIWRFCKLRWDATERTYEYFIALAVNEAKDASSPSTEE